MLHTAGMHNVTRNEIWTSTYQVLSTHELVYNITRNFKIGNDLKVVGITTSPSDNLFDVYITYYEFNSNGSPIGKVLYTNLYDSTSVKLFSFMDPNVGSSVITTLFK